MPRWSDNFLNEIRQIGDPAADQVVRELLDTGSLKAVNDLLTRLIRNDDPLAQDLPQSVRNYLQDSAAVLRGEDLFGLYGPEILLILGLYSLPFTYSNQRGVKVIHRTAYLKDQARRRLFETMQLVIDVMQPGGLRPTGRGLRSIQKVRLMHAGVRALLIRDPHKPWDLSLGVPINQEDMSMTLMSFSYVALLGLEAMGISVTIADQEAYLRTWNIIGRLMGVREDLLPVGIGEAAALSGVTFHRHVGATLEAAQLAGPLLRVMGQLLPGRLLDGLPATMCRHYFASGPFAEARVPDLLHMPPADWTRLLVRATVAYGRLVGSLGDSADLAQLIRPLSLRLCESLLVLGRGPGRTPFMIPDSLQARWWRRRKPRKKIAWPSMNSVAPGA